MVFLSLKETMNFNQCEICLARATIKWLQQTDLTVSTKFIQYFIQSSIVKLTKMLKPAKLRTKTLNTDRNH